MYNDLQLEDSEYQTKHAFKVANSQGCTGWHGSSQLKSLLFGAPEDMKWYY